MLTASSQTTPAVPIGLKKAQENVSGAMGEGAGAHGPIVSEQPIQTTSLKNPKKKIPLQYLIAGIILLLVIIGGGAVFYLSSIGQDLRQRAAGCTYWTGGGNATDGACDCRGPLLQQCIGGYWSAPSSGACDGMTCGAGGVIASPSPKAAACANDSESCESLGCCGDSVCQGTAGSRVCQNPGPGDQCPGGGTCTGYYSFQCSSLAASDTSNGVPVCQNNPQFHGTDQGGAQSRAAATGCGQWDQVCVGGTNSGKLCGGFSIINNNCGGDSAPQPLPETTPTPQPSPQVSPSPSVSPSPVVSPTPSPIPTPTPNVTPTPAPVGCSGACNVSTDCAVANHICYEYAEDGNPDGGVCRLLTNPTSTACVEPSPLPTPTPTVGCNEVCSTNADCSNTNHVCFVATSTCRLATNPDNANCAPAPTPTPSPAPGCNDTCYRSSDCNFAAAVCYDNLCRLDTNPTSPACEAETTAGTYYQQPALPTTLPQSGSEDILNWLKIGLGALGLGLIFLFL